MEHGHYECTLCRCVISMYLGWRVSLWRLATAPVWKNDRHKGDVPSRDHLPRRANPYFLPYITAERFLPSIARLRMCIIHSTVARTRWRKVFDARIYCARGWLIARNAVREISMTMNKYRATVQSCASSIKLEYTHEDVRFFRNFLRKYISSFKILTILFYFFEEEEDDSWYHSRNHYSVDIDLKKASNNRKEGFFLE